MSSGVDRSKLRSTFEQIPELYDQARPVYPAQLFEDLIKLAQLRPNNRVLEIGPGTGQGTLPLAGRDLEIVAVELGEGLAAVARRKLAEFPKVEVVTADFETWEPAEADFDAVVAFTAFHWIDPELRYAKPARLLRAGGVLASIGTQHVRLPGSDRFWVDVQADYDAVDPQDDNRPPPYPDEVKDLSEEIEASGHFKNVAARRYTWNVTYTADQYIAVLDTYSGHRSLEPKKRQELYDRIHRRVNATPDGSVTKTYLAMLNMARRQPK